MIDHDEKDCMQWMRSKESLKAEDKQYGPWLRATSERVQRPQLVVASKNEGRKEHKAAADGVSMTAEQLVNTGRELTAAAIQNAHGDDDVATCRAKVAPSDEPEGHEIMRIPCNPQCPGFEEQLKEIDDAIFGEVLTKETSTKRAAGEKEALKEISQLDVTNASHNADKADGSGLLLKPICNKGQHEEPRKEGSDWVPIKSGDIFTVGLCVQRPKGEIKTRKGKVSAQKQIKLGKENNKEEGGKGIQGEATEMEVVMGIEDDGVGMKRRVRTPLNEILDNGMTRKRSRVEGEVLTLSKLMAQRLGAAEAVGQPRREP